MKKTTRTHNFKNSFISIDSLQTTRMHNFKNSLSVLIVYTHVDHIMKIGNQFESEIEQIRTFLTKLRQHPKKYNRSKGIRKEKREKQLNMVGMTGTVQCENIEKEKLKLTDVLIKWVD